MRKKRETDETRKQAFEKAVCDYYGACSAEEREELAEWGEFAECEFPHQAFDESMKRPGQTIGLCRLR